MTKGSMFVCSFVRLCMRHVRLSRNVLLCTTNKGLDLEVPVFAHIGILTMYIRLPIFILIGP